MPILQINFKLNVPPAEYRPIMAPPDVGSNPVLRRSFLSVASSYSAPHLRPVSH